MHKRTLSRLLSALLPFQCSSLIMHMGQAVSQLLHLLLSLHKGCTINHLQITISIQSPVQSHSCMATVLSCLQQRNDPLHVMKCVFFSTKLHQQMAGLCYRGQIWKQSFTQAMNDWRHRCSLHFSVGHHHFSPVMALTHSQSHTKKD